MKAENQLKLNLYLERQELTHRQRINGAWSEYCAVKGIERGDKVPRSFKNLAIKEDWHLLWIPQRRTRDEIASDISSDFANILSIQTKNERMVNEIKSELKGIIIEQLGRYAELRESSSELDEDELEYAYEELDSILKRIDFVAGTIRKLQTGSTFYERAQALFNTNK